MRKWDIRSSKSSFTDGVAVSTSSDDMAASGQPKADTASSIPNEAGHCDTISQLLRSLHIPKQNRPRHSLGHNMSCGHHTQEKFRKINAREVKSNHSKLNRNIAFPQCMYFISFDWNCIVSELRGNFASAASEKFSPKCLQPHTTLRRCSQQK